MTLSSWIIRALNLTEVCKTIKCAFQASDIGLGEDISSLRISKYPGVEQIRLVNFNVEIKQFL